MIPIVTPDEMTAIDADAAEPLDVLIDRAGRAVARTAVAMLGGTYGRRVVVVSGPGNNGADGRVAAEQLRRRGVRVRVVGPDHGDALVGVDLVVDAAFGTGLRRPYAFPAVEQGIPVLAVDIPSGVDGLTGAALGTPCPADRTITFAALKPGLVFEPGRSLAGDVEVVDLGLDVSRATVDLVEGADVAEWLPVRSAVRHKWHHAVRIVGGSAAMTGAPRLAARSAQRMGAGYVQVAVPGRHGLDEPAEAVGVALPSHHWGSDAADGLDRVGAVLVGPGLGPGHDAAVAELAASAVPLVVDGDALQPGVIATIADRDAPTILTPHGGEFTRLGGSSTTDAVTATRELAARAGSVVVHKGPTTIVAASDGPVLVVANGDAALATAGTGDVLAGAIVALVAQGVDPLRAAACAAWLHAEAGRGRAGLVASDLPARMANLLHDA